MKHTIYIIAMLICLAACGDSKHITDPNIIHAAKKKTILITRCPGCYVQSFKVYIVDADTFYICHRMFRKDALKPLPKQFKVWNK